jgi:hypothetical protein
MNNTEIEIINNSPYGINGEDVVPDSNKNPYIISAFPPGRKVQFYSRRYDRPNDFAYKFKVIRNNNFYEMDVKFNFPEELML